VNEEGPTNATWQEKARLPLSGVDGGAFIYYDDLSG